MNEYLEKLKLLKESEDHIEFKAARHNYPFAGGFSGQKLNVFELLILYALRFDGHLPGAFPQESLERLLADGLVQQTADGYSLGEAYNDILRKTTPFATDDGERDGESKLTERQKIIFGRITDNPSEMAEEMAKALNIGRRTLDREYAALRKLGYIKKSRKDNNSPWLILK